MTVEEAKGVFDELTKAYPESCWAHEAKRRLSSLSMLETGKE
jgi:outer membrane protein assembly factor BamD (BamD/ComL family)